MVRKWAILNLHYDKYPTLVVFANKMNWAYVLLKFYITSIFADLKKAFP